MHLSKVNDHGLRLAAENATAHIKEIRVYDENGSVQLWVELSQQFDGRELLVYLTPYEASVFSASLQKCASAASLESLERATY